MLVGPDAGGTGGGAVGGLGDIGGTGPTPSDVVVAWEATTPASGLDQVLIERAPDWARIPDVVPLASGDMAGFAMAASVSRVAVVSVNRTATPPSVGYFEFSR